MAKDLAGKIADGRENAEDPFSPQHVVVPNGNVAQWLKLRIAQRNGVCAGVRFPFFDRFLWEALASLLPADERPESLVSTDDMQLAIAEILLADSSSADLEPFRRYCRGNADGARTTLEGLLADRTRATDVSRRLWQLSGRLASYMREYELQRTAEVEAWLRGRQPVAGGGEVVAAEAALYRRLFGVGGRFGPGGAKASLRQLLARVGKGATGRADAGGGDVFVFGISTMSAVHAAALHRIAAERDVVFYHFSVCLECWDDIQTPWERAAAAKRGDRLRDFCDAGENELLAQLGVAGRETMGLLVDLEEGGATMLEVGGGGAPRGGTVLAAVQGGVRRRRSGEERVVQDDSLQVVGCPGLFREIEMVYNSILGSALARTGEEAAGEVAGLGLRKDAISFSEIAVLVPDMAKYRPVIEAVFGARGEIPYGLVDGNASRESLYASGLAALLAMASSPFTRSAVLEFFSNPHAQAAAGIDDAGLGKWAGWCDRLGVFRFHDAADREAAGFGRSELFTWRYALKRLRLGRVAESLPEGVPGLGPAYSDRDTEGDECAAFCTCLERLMERLVEMRSAARPCAGWAAAVKGLADEFLEIPADDSQDARMERMVRARAFSTIDALAGGFAPDLEVPVEFVAQYISDKMAGMPCGRGRYLKGGVTFASLQPMRPVPFRHVYVVGLGEGEFPGEPNESTLDIRALSSRPEIGDSSVPNTNRLLFLETLMATRERLVLSYVAEDVCKDEPKFPCSVVKLLERFVSENILPRGPDGAATEFREVRLPLLESDGRCCAAPAESGAWDCGVVETLSLSRRVECGLRADAAGTAAALARHRDRLPAEIAALLARQTAARAATGAGGSPSETVEVRIRDLADFLNLPHATALKARLGVWPPKDGSAAAEADEPIRTEKFGSQWHGLAEAALEAAFSERGYGDAAVDAEYGCQQRASVAPAGVFGDADKEAQKAAFSIEFTNDGFRDFLGRHPGERRRTLKVGPASGGAEPGTERAECELALSDGRTARLVGDQPLWFAADGGEPEACFIASGTAYRHIVRPLLVMLARRAALDGAAAPMRVTAMSTPNAQGEARFAEFEHPGMSGAEARAYLKQLVEYFLSDKAFAFSLEKADFNGRMEGTFEIADGQSGLDAGEIADALRASAGFRWKGNPDEAALAEFADDLLAPLCRAQSLESVQDAGGRKR